MSCLTARVLLILNPTVPRWVLLAPMIVLKELNVKNKKELQNISDLPEKEAEKHFDRYEMLLKRDKFETSNFESKVLRQFKRFRYSLRK